MLKIGFFIPEFPGQTHIFLWRERQALAELGIQADLISTRPPPRSIASHSWGAAAQAQTRYLLPLEGGPLRLVADLLRAGPRGWMRGLSAALRAETQGGLKGRVRMLALLAMGARLAGIARDRGWTHVHVHSCADSANIAMFAQRLGGPSYSLTLHGPTLDGYGPNQRQKWRHARFATIISRLLLGVAQREIGPDLPPVVLVAPMGVDLAQIRRAAPWQPPAPGTPLRVFSCGRLNAVKGHDHLIRTIQILRDQGIDARLEIAGEDEQGGSGYRRQLEALIAQAGLQDVVTLLGAVSEDRVRQGLEQAHVFALASLNEGISVAIMEAMAMEMPVVVTDVGGNHELITSGRDAILVPPERPEIMAAEIARLYAEPDHARQLAQASRARVEQDFHHRRSAQAVAEGLARTLPGAAAHLRIAPATDSPHPLRQH
ncbi:MULTISPECIES: exopolysaccharide biosynthesis GT4 family glycosyltransferase EpsE [unclassified Paracoccus (in: a-proteobacteria)]|uniref:exopolysaccharide biosynthesis GT4 family glycosyltransferase EpsE n=1 Tax=unclassified Paracoccus (in: a-proteobacteria) TaxID=2688777 RepID=UPI00138362B5|nr:MULTISPECIES: exopolysaccharide biosynthesis GT4 family glycosyltransferase EpsE [unclassified Paracoccus (in: a-proteobacteria)]UXU75164.1 glycosyltransferase family 4 protein [Paracoccus sp. SMMA_5]UXU81066.1 glycosyltransferase family 4 protein [Paracoccus sp. SMMA_5_TC]